MLDDRLIGEDRQNTEIPSLRAKNVTSLMFVPTPPTLEGLLETLGEVTASQKRA